MLLCSPTAHAADDGGEHLDWNTAVASWDLFWAGTGSHSSTELGSLLPWSQQLWGHHLPHHPELKSLARQMWAFILCNKKKQLLRNLVLPFQVTDISSASIWCYVDEKRLWEEAESTPHVAFTSQNHSWPLMEASGDRGKISGVWEDPILVHVFTFSKQEGNLFPVGTTRGMLAILVSNEPPMGREHKSIFAYLPSSLSPNKSEDCLLTWKMKPRLNKYSGRLLCLLADSAVGSLLLPSLLSGCMG